MHLNVLAESTSSDLVVWNNLTAVTWNHEVFAAGLENLGRTAFTNSVHLASIYWATELASATTNHSIRYVRKY